MLVMGAQLSPASHPVRGSAGHFQLHQLQLFGEGRAPRLHRSESPRRPLTCSVCLCVCADVCACGSECDLQQQAAAAVMSVQAVLSQGLASNTHSHTLSLGAGPDTCSPDVGGHS